MNITLPGLTNKIKLNILFIDFCNLHKDILINDKLYFTVYGSIPQNTWSGHYNLQGPLILYKKLNSILEEYTYRGVCCRFDCSNLLIDTKDYNVFGKILLECGNNGSNQIEISTPLAYDFFSNTYPMYHFIGSSSMIDYPSNLDILVRNKFNMDIPNNYKNKIEYIINSPCCLCNFEQQTKCILKECLNINTFSSDSIYNCSTQTFTLEKNIYNNNIQIGEYNNTLQQLQSYIYYLIKPEFQLQATNELMAKLMEDKI